MKAASVKVGAIIMAAGRSRRMGSNKLLADLGGQPMVAHVVDAVRDAGWPPPVVVTGHDAPAIGHALAGRAVRLVHAPDHATGLSRSIAAGITAVPGDWAAAAICLGDMPLIRPELLRRLAAHAREDAIVLPLHAGRRGNPVLWGRDHFPALLTLDGDVGGRALFDRRADAIVEVVCDDATVLVDADTPDALSVLRKSFAERT